LKQTPSGERRKKGMSGSQQDRGEGGTRQRSSGAIVSQRCMSGKKGRKEREDEALDYSGRAFL